MSHLSSEYTCDDISSEYMCNGTSDCQKIAVGDGVNKLIHVIGMKLDEDKKTFWDLLGSGQVIILSTKQLNIHSMYVDMVNL